MVSSLPRFGVMIYSKCLLIVLAGVNFSTERNSPSHSLKRHQAGSKKPTQDIHNLPKQPSCAWPAQSQRNSLHVSSRSLDPSRSIPQHWTISRLDVLCKVTTARIFGGASTDTVSCQRWGIQQTYQTYYIKGKKR